MSSIVGAVIGLGVAPHPVVAPGQPLVIQLGLRNVGDKPAKVDAFEDPRCFSAAYVGLRLIPSAPAKPIPRCQARRQTLAPGEELWVQLDLSSMFETGAKHTVEFDWKFKPPPSYGTLVGTDPLYEAPVVHEGRFTKGVPVELPAGRLTITGHNHKRTLAGETSPLLISYAWEPKKGEPVLDGSTRFEPKFWSQIQLGPYTIQRTAHSYDDWIDLRIFDTAID